MAKIMEDITPMVQAIDDNRGLITQLMAKIHEDMDHALLKGTSSEPTGDRDKSLFLILVQTYVVGFLTAECNPTADFTDAIRFYYAKGIEHGHVYLEARRQNSQ